MTLDYANYGIFLIMGNAGCISSARLVFYIRSPAPMEKKNESVGANVLKNLHGLWRSELSLRTLNSARVRKEPFDPT